MLDFQILFNLAVGIIGVIGGILLNRTLKVLDDLASTDDRIESQVNQIRIDMTATYMPRSEIKELVHEIKNGIDRIESKLDKKVDK